MHELPAFCPRCRRSTISVGQHLDHHERVTLDRCCGSLKARARRPRTLDDQLVVSPADRARKRSRPRLRCARQRWPLPLQLSGLDVGEEISLVNPDPATAEVVGLELAGPDPAIS
jgi:hypothetical protein